MATGQVGFKDNKMVRRVYVQKRENTIVNRLNKTRVEKFPDLRAEKAGREREIARTERMAAQAKVRSPDPYTHRSSSHVGLLTTFFVQKKEDAKVAEERQQLKYQKQHMYDDLHTEENLQETSNQDRDANFEDDFM